MLNTVYRLIEPKRIEAEFCDIDVGGDDVIIRPTHLSICNADQRYYRGLRTPDVLRSKLPMALIHEAMGVVLFDPKKEFRPGTRVVMVPNMPQEEDEMIGENYLRSSHFRGSGYDGFMQDLVALRRDRAIELPDIVDDCVAAFTELVSVCYHAIDRFDKKAHGRRDRIGVWGDGNVAFITSLLLKRICPESEVLVFGKHRYKLDDFVFADETCLIDDLQGDPKIDHAFECVGGSASSEAINQIIDTIMPEGTIAIMGVSESGIAVNTRMILEKGLTAFGSSRSGAYDFKRVIEIYKNDPGMLEYLERTVGEIVEVRTLEDMSCAFEKDINKTEGKTIMKWLK